jgi:hypothetical protein
MMARPRIVLFSLVALVGCSASLDWEAEGLRCDTDNPCLEGYSCRATECVTQHSLAKNQTCTDDNQCDFQYICSPEKKLICTTKCSYFYTSDDCPYVGADGRGDFCMPVSDTSIRGVCMPGDVCNSGEDCQCNGDNCTNLGDTCVEVSDSTRVCQVGCEVMWGLAGPDAYTDTCAPTAGEPTYCQPVGAIGKQKLVCLDATTAQDDGDTCTVGSQPCNRGSLCVNDRCNGYCNRAWNPESDLSGSNPGCSETEFCCALGLTSDDTLGYCSESCGN